MQNVVGNVMLNIKKRMQSNGAFMGQTHMALSLALFMVVFLAYPAVLPSSIGSNLALFLLSLLCVAGTSLLPDLDNTRSAARSNLGLFGNFLSFFFRKSSNFIYRISKSRRDDARANPHRGFWHTAISSVVVYLAVWATIRIPFSFYSERLRQTLMVGEIFAAFWLFIAFYLAVSMLDSLILGVDLNQGLGGTLIAMVLSFILVIISIKEGMLNTIEHLPFLYLFGFLTHIIGDLFTPMGVPFFFPLSFKGKRWWRVRLMRLPAGGFGEKYVVLPLSVLTTVVSLGYVVLNYSTIW